MINYDCHYINYDLLLIKNKLKQKWEQASNL